MQPEKLRELIPITIKGVRVEEIQIGKADERGGFRVTSAVYSLISSTGKVLAKQAIGGYSSGVSLEPSAPTVKALETFMALYVDDICTVLGLNSE